MKRGLARIIQEHGNLHDVIPAIVNRIGQYRAAKELGVSAFTVNRWLKDNGYCKKIIYVRDEHLEKRNDNHC